jgi:hypothetical protein
VKLKSCSILIERISNSNLKNSIPIGEKKETISNQSN